VHLDIKPKNGKSNCFCTKGDRLTSLVLIGDLDEQHTATEIFKIDDFGIALPVPDKPDALEWLDRVGERGTEGWIPPVPFPLTFCS
jgi:serine/threonine protein kinase